MTAQEALSSENIFLKNETIGGLPCSVGYIKKFKWSWFATQMNLYVIVADVAQPLDKQTIDSFSEACYNYAIKNNKGWPRGLQAAVGSIAIIRGANIELAASEYAETVMKKNWSAFEIPIVIDSDVKRVYRFKNKPIWGMIYVPFFVKTIESITAKLV